MNCKDCGLPRRLFKEKTNILVEEESVFYEELLGFTSA